MKILGACMVFFAAAGLGMYQAGRIRKGYEELVYLKKVILYIRGEIQYRILGMGELFQEISDKVKQPYASAFFQLGQTMEEGRGENFSTMWEEIVIKALDPVIVCEKDRDRLKELGENLGFLDKEMQMNYLNFFLENLDVSIAEKREKVQSDEKLCKILGILLGILLVVFLW